MRKYKFFILFVVSVLSGCAGYDGYFRVYSDLERVRNKTVYYEVTDPSVITARVNRNIEKALSKKGWRIVQKDKADYVYTVSTDEKEQKYTSTYLYSTDFGTFGGTNIVSSYYPRVFITIFDVSRKENVYEMFFILNPFYSKKDLESILSKKGIQDSLFFDKDISRDVFCELIYNEKTQAFETEDCRLSEY